MGPGRRRARSGSIRRLRRRHQPVGRRHRRQAVDRRLQGRAASRVALQTTELLANTIAALDQHALGVSVRLGGRLVRRSRRRAARRTVVPAATTSSATSVSNGKRQRWSPRRPASEPSISALESCCRRTGGALKKQLPLFKARARRTLRQRSSMAELDLDRRRGRRHRPSVVGRRLRSRQPDRARAGDQHRVHEHARQGVAPARRAAGTAVRARRSCSAGELVESLLLAGQRVLPTALQRSGYEFRHRRWKRRYAPSSIVSDNELLIGGVDRCPSSEFGIEIEPLGRRARWPTLLRHCPHHLELDPVGIVRRTGSC